MTAALYIFLGLSIGIGLTLIYLQERFNRERRLLVAMGESERAKSAQMLKELNEEWNRKFKQAGLNSQKYTPELDEESPQPAKHHDSHVQEEDINRINDLEEIILQKEASAKELQVENKSLHRKQADHQQAIDTLQSKISLLKKEIKEDDTDGLQQSLAIHQQEISDLQNEITFLKGEVTKLEEDKKQSVTLAGNGDFLVLSPGHHLLPGSVVKSFLKK